MKEAKAKITAKHRKGANETVLMGPGVGAVYRQIDKIEFFVPEANIEVEDKPTQCFLVGVPATDALGDLRYEKINSIRVHIWNRGSSDLYVEVLQPFGATSSPKTIVAWGPVRGRKKKAQTKWTIKANKSGGNFSIDVTANALTTPAVLYQYKDNIKYMYLLAFGFTVTRNKATFVGAPGGESSRALQFRIVVDYIGPQTETPRAGVSQQTSDMFGKVNQYPMVDSNNINGDLVCRAGVDRIRPEEVPVCCTYNRRGHLVQPPEPFSLIKLPGQLDRHFDGVLVQPVANYAGHLMLFPRTTGPPVMERGYGNAIVPLDMLDVPEGAIDLPNGYYLACGYVKDSTKRYAPLASLDNEELPQLAFDMAVQDQDKMAHVLSKFSNMIRKSTVKRPVIVREVSQVTFIFSMTAFLDMVNVILKMVEAAVAAYEIYTPSNLKTILDAPLHEKYVEESFQFLN